MRHQGMLIVVHLFKQLRGRKTGSSKPIQTLESSTQFKYGENTGHGRASTVYLCGHNFLEGTKGHADEVTEVQFV